MFINIIKIININEDFNMKSIFCYFTNSFYTFITFMYCITVVLFILSNFRKLIHWHLQYQDVTKPPQNSLHLPVLLSSVPPFRPSSHYPNATASVATCPTSRTVSLLSLALRGRHHQTLYLAPTFTNISPSRTGKSRG